MKYLLAQYDLSSRVMGLMSHEELPAKDLFGYERQVRAGLGIAVDVAKRGNRRILVFGYPGTGKSAFPYAIARRLNKDFGYNFSVAYVRCDELCIAVGMEWSARKALSDMAEKTSRKKPLIVYLDEMDAIGSISDSGAPQCPRFMTSWIIEFLNRIEERTLVLGITNYPNKMRKSLIRYFNIPIYFEPTNKRIVEMIIRHYLNVDNPERVAEFLINDLKKFDLRVMSSDLITGCSEIRSTIGSLENELDETVASIIKRYTSPCSCGHLVKDYESNNRNLIELSLKHMQFWTHQYKVEGALNKNS